MKEKYKMINDLGYLKEKDRKRRRRVGEVGWGRKR